MQINPTIRMWPKDWDKLKSLKRASGLPWPTFIKYVNRITQDDMNLKIASELKKFKEEKQNDKRNSDL